MHVYKSIYQTLKFEHVELVEITVTPILHQIYLKIIYQSFLEYTGNRLIADGI